MNALLGAIGLLAVGAFAAFLVYCFEHSPTARSGKYSCYALKDGRLCLAPISAERARAGQFCEECEARR